MAALPSPPNADDLTTMTLKPPPLALWTLNVADVTSVVIPEVSKNPKYLLHW